MLSCVELEKSFITSGPVKTAHITKRDKQKIKGLLQRDARLSYLQTIMFNYNIKAGGGVGRLCVYA